MILAPGFDAVLNRRLTRDAASPLVVAYSGGGDSLALLLATKGWADRAGRAVIAVTVDHRLQAASARWTQACADRAAALGVAHRALAWEGERPAGGLPAAARAARHRLLAHCARAEGASVVMMGHTHDDRLEAMLMQGEGSTVSWSQEWAPSPAWPEGRGIFLLRPMLGLRRSAIRRALSTAGEAWIEDPANVDLNSARARARTALGGSQGMAITPDSDRVQVGHLACQVREQVGGILVLDRAAVAEATQPVLTRLIGLILLCAAGGERPPRREKLQRLAQRITTEGAFVSTLAGARLEADAQSLRFGREPGEQRRHKLSGLVLEPGRPVVWDGRFEIMAITAGWTLTTLAGLAARLPKDQRAKLKPIPAGLRKGLPTLLRGRDASCPQLSENQDVTLRSLILDRLKAASGGIVTESASASVAETPQTP